MSEPQPMRFELVKVICQTVVAVRVGDRIVDEVEGQHVACYGIEQVAALWEQTDSEIAAKNAESNGGNRAQRRARKPKEVTQ